MADNSPFKHDPALYPSSGRLDHDTRPAGRPASPRRLPRDSARPIDQEESSYYGRPDEIIEGAAERGVALALGTTDESKVEDLELLKSTAEAQCALRSGIASAKTEEAKRNEHQRERGGEEDASAAEAHIHELDTEIVEASSTASKLAGDQAKLTEVQRETPGRGIFVGAFLGALIVDGTAFRGALRDTTGSGWEHWLTTIGLTTVAASIAAIIAVAAWAVWTRSANLPRRVRGWLALGLALVGLAILWLFADLQAHRNAAAEIDVLSVSITPQFFLPAQLVASITISLSTFFELQGRVGRRTQRNLDEANDRVDDLKAERAEQRQRKHAAHAAAASARIRREALPNELAAQREAEAGLRDLSYEEARFNYLRTTRGSAVCMRPITARSAFSASFVLYSLALASVVALGAYLIGAAPVGAVLLGASVGFALALALSRRVLTQRLHIVGDHWRPETSSAIDPATAAALRDLLDEAANGKEAAR